MFRVGDRVRFGRPTGEQTLGTVLKVNRASLKVQTDEGRGNGRGSAVGATWKVAVSLCRLADSPHPAAQEPPLAAPTPFFPDRGAGLPFGGINVAPPSPVPPQFRPPLRIGQTVEFTTKKGQVLRGLVSSVNQKSVSVITPNGGWRVAPSLLRVVEELGEKSL